METKGVDSIRYTTGMTRRKSETVVIQIGMIEDDVKYSLASDLWDRRQNDRLKQEDCATSVKTSRYRITAVGENSLKKVIGDHLPIMLDEHLQGFPSARKQPRQCAGAVLLELGLNHLCRKDLSAKY